MDTGQIVGLILGSSALAALVSGIVTMSVSKWTIAQQKAALRQQSLTETTRLMLDLMEAANNANGVVGAGHQLAAVDLVATVGIENTQFRLAAFTFLDSLNEQMARGSEVSPSRAKVAEAAMAAKKRLDAY